VIQQDREARDHRDDDEKKIKVEVRTPEGEHTQLKANPTDTVGSLKAQAITKLDIRPAPGVQYFLFLGGKRLDDAATLSAAGVRDDAVLVLASEPQVGAAR
jgi:hypothetical protein